MVQSKFSLEEILNKDIGEELEQYHELVKKYDSETVKIHLNAYNRYNLVVSSLTLFVLLTWATPLSTLFNKGYGLAMKTVNTIGEVKEETAEKLDQAGNVVKTLVGDIGATPKKGDKIAGFTVTDVMGSPREGGKRKHAGVDIATPVGTQFYAPEDVMVECFDYQYNPANQRSGEGNWETGASFKISNGMKVRVIHLLHKKCVSGLIKKGKVIGVSGHPSAPHLHIEVSDANGVLINPPTIIINALLTGNVLKLE